MEHSWQGEVIFPQAMQGSLSNAPSAVSSSSLLSCQARIRKLLYAPFVRTIFTPAHGSNIGQSPMTSTSCSILKGECKTASLRAPSPPSASTYAAQTSEWNFNTGNQYAQQQRPRCIQINLQVQTHRTQGAIDNSGLRRWCLPGAAASPPRHTRAGCIHRSFSLRTIVAALCRSSHSVKNSDLAARVGRRAINFLVITRAESSIQLTEGANLLMC